MIMLPLGAGRTLVNKVAWFKWCGAMHVPSVPGEDNKGQRPQSTLVPSFILRYACLMQVGNTSPTRL